VLLLDELLEFMRPALEALLVSVAVTPVQRATKRTRL